jgi:hypothetical protein
VQQRQPRGAKPVFPTQTEFHTVAYGAIGRLVCQYRSPDGGERQPVA